MAESSKRNPRKSKLVLREIIEVDEVLSATTNLEESKTSLLDRIKNTNDDGDTEDYTTSPKSVEFSIEVEVEPCLGKSMESEPDVEEICKAPDDIKFERIIPNDVIHREIQITAERAKNFIENRLKVEAYNCLGKTIRPPELNNNEKLIQEALNKWRGWAIASKLRVDVLAYKCIICSLGWWYLEPFAEHIKIHKHVKISLETMHHECCVIATAGEWFESMCQIFIEDNCPRCLRGYKEHTEQKKGSLYYICKGCNETFNNCRLLFAHEGVCVRFEKLLYLKGSVVHEEQWRCNICKVRCLTENRHKEHLSRYHDVRSDDPVVTQQLRECAVCGLGYFTFSFHWCPKKADNQKCPFCWRRFQSRSLAKLHEVNSAGSLHCPVCNMYLKTQCMLSRHLLVHSKLYSLVYKCTECADNVILGNEILLIYHKKAWHGAKDKKKGMFDPLILPRQLLTHEWVASAEQIAEMILELNPKTTAAPPPPKDPKKEEEEAISRVEKIMQRRNEHKRYVEKIEKIKKDNERTQTLINNVSKEIANKFLNRAKSRNTGSFESDVSQKSHDEIQNAIGLLQEEINIKNETEHEDFNDATAYDDNDINETENSVNALLGNINTKYEIDIDETDLSHYSISEESQEDLVKQETENNLESEQGSSNDKVDCENQQSDDDVEIIGDDRENITDWIDISDDDEIEKEQQACLEELSKVFQAVKKTKSLKLNLQVNEVNVKIKEEPIKEVLSTSNALEQSNSEHIEIKTEPINEISKDIEKANQSDCTKESILKVHEIKKNPDEEITSIISIEETVLNNELQKDPIEEIKEIVRAAKKSKTAPDSKSFDIKKDLIFEAPEMPLASEATSLETSTEPINIKKENETTKLLQPETEKKSNSIELTNLQAFEVTVKEEPMEIEDDDDDIIVIRNDNSGPNLEVKVTSETLNSSSENLKIESDHETEPGPSSGRKKKFTNGKGRLYGCGRCDFIGKHKDYAQHINICRKQGRCFGEMRCSKCDLKFSSLMKYVEHFPKVHDYPNWTCPQCFLVFKRGTIVHHVTSHIKKSFVKVHLLKELAYFTTSWSGVHECKVCQNQVIYKEFFKHWENHLILKGEADDEDKFGIKELRYSNVKQPKKKETVSSSANDQSANRRPIRLKHGDKLLLDPSDLKSLVVQLLSEWREKKCVHCAYSFVRCSDLKRHLIEHLLSHAYASAQRGVLCCPICSLQTNTSRLFKMHMRQHAGLNIFRCEICDKCFSDSSNFAKHKKVHNINSTSCKICGKKFSLDKHMEKHMEQHRSIEPKQCEVCYTMCYSESEYSRHMRRRHKAKRTHFLCKYCRDKFPALKLLWDHLWEVHKVRKITADCPICDKSFRKYTLVQAHMRTEHQMSIARRSHIQLAQQGLNRKERHEKLLQIMRKDIGAIDSPASDSSTGSKPVDIVEEELNIISDSLIGLNKDT